jgi:hypothetical protein
LRLFAFPNRPFKPASLVLNPMARNDPDDDQRTEMRIFRFLSGVFYSLREMFVV